MKAVECADSQNMGQEVVLRECGVDDLARPELTTMLSRDVDAAACGVVVEEFQIPGVPELAM